MRFCQLARSDVFISCLLAAQNENKSMVEYTEKPENWPCVMRVGKLQVLGVEDILENQMLSCRAAMLVQSEPDKSNGVVFRGDKKEDALVRPNIRHFHGHRFEKDDRRVLKVVSEKQVLKSQAIRSYLVGPSWTTVEPCNKLDLTPKVMPCLIRLASIPNKQQRNKSN
uniref:Uncharacterized protein n=1 Tax=Ditylenchus dipsaci TaxID=166011 RepID=A0A915DRH6_9BILA